MISRAPPVIYCPNCRAASNAGAVQCSTCGGILPVERLLAEGKARFRQVVASSSRTIGFLWLLALTPLLIVPPLAAIVLSFRRSKGGEDDRFMLISLAAINVALSIMAWRWIGKAAFDFVMAVLTVLFPATVRGWAI